ncbi:hypothetical protein SAMN05216359_112130 [Roseateles sp. YR242]|nr:hypothetical protein SAMN05216359_112130 [Roseateles sp. YR242]
MQFVPENFVTLPPDLALPPIEETGWEDPLGASTVRANAIRLSLGGGSPQPGVSGLSPTSTFWSRALPHRTLLQMQPPAPGNDRAMAGFGAALMAEDISDLLIVAPSVKEIDKEGIERVGFNNKNLAHLAALDGGGYTYNGTQISKQRCLEVQCVEPKTPNMDRWPQGSISVSARNALYRPKTHGVTTHWLDIQNPRWVKMLLQKMKLRWLDNGKSPMKLGVMCHNGASESGVVAVALHAMQCLERLNRQELSLNNYADLAAQMRNFVRSAWAERSPSFADAGPNLADYDKLAEEIWKQWNKINGAPDSAAVQTLRSPSLPSAANVPRPVAEAFEISTVGTTSSNCTQQLRRQGVGRAIHELLKGQAADPPGEKALEQQEVLKAERWFADAAEALLDGPASKLKLSEVMGGNVIIEEAGGLTAGLTDGMRPLVARVVAEGGEAMRERAETMAARLQSDEAAQRWVHDRFNRAQTDLLTVPPNDVEAATAFGRDLQKQAMVLALMNVLKAGIAQPVPAVRPQQLDLPTQVATSPNLPGESKERRVRRYRPRVEPDRSRSSSDSLSPSSAQRGGVQSPTRSVLISPDAFRSPTHSVQSPPPGSPVSAASSGKPVVTDKALEFLEALKLAESSNGAIEDVNVPDALRSEWRPGGQKFIEFMPRLEGLVKEMTGTTGLRGFVRSKLRTSPLRDLTSHLAWAKDVGRAVRENPALETKAGAALSYEAVRGLLQERFNSLSTDQKERWRSRVAGHSSRFEQALTASKQEADALPRLINPSGSLTNLNEVPFSSRPNLLLGSVEPKNLLNVVDAEWAPYLALTLVREVAGVRA